MMSDYRAFLAAKKQHAEKDIGFAPTSFHGPLFDFQQAATRVALRRGRCALFLDTGLGKTLCQLEFLLQTAERSNGKALLCAPLAVAKQIEREAVKHGYPARVVRDARGVKKGISIVNYDRLHLLDLSVFGAVSLDESAILKAQGARVATNLINVFRQTPFRLAATATPAPNDFMELGQHSEFLGVLRHAEMLPRWFINDTSDTGTWRLKRHAELAFWDWVASWAVMAETPDDLGFDGSAFKLPPLEIVTHKTIGEKRPSTSGGFFSGRRVSATNIHDIKRGTIEARGDAAKTVWAEDPDAAWVQWVDTDYEADVIKRLLPNALEVRGSMPIELKERNLEAFSDGAAKILITKPSIAGMGLNWQHCHNMSYVGRSFSYQDWYQSVRRCWRFGQKERVRVHIIVAAGEDQIGTVIERKSEDHAYMKQAMRAASLRNLTRDAGAGGSERVDYQPQALARMPSWLEPR